MPIDLQIIRANEFVRLGPREQLDLASSKEALTLLVKACQKRGIDRALLDLRALPSPAKPLFTPNQLASLVETFREAGFTPQQKLAVLYQSDPHHGVRLFAFISSMSGMTVRAFNDFEKGITWLSFKEADANTQPAKKHGSKRRKPKD